MLQKRAKCHGDIIIASVRPDGLSTCLLIEKVSQMVGVVFVFPAFGGLGLFGNLVSIIVLLSKDMRSNCFNNILTALNITDSLHIVFAIMEVLRVDFNGVYNYFLPHSFFPYFHYPAYRICLCASIYLIMAGESCGSEKLVSNCFSRC